jgi:serine/threonine protein kinase
MRVVEQEDEEDASLSHDDVLLETEQRCPDDVIESVKELLSGNSDTDIFDIIGQEHRPPNFTSMVGTEEQEEEEEEEESMPQRPVGLHETPLPSSESGRPFDELYRLKGILGTGAFSTVREGYHRSNVKQSYAIKCINRKKLSEDDEAALLDEVAILKELRHTHIIRLYDFFEEPSAYYLVMERMRGGELFDRIVAKAYYNEKEARDTCKLIIQAVAHCHDNHIAHRDLKPENLLLLSETDDTSVKLADFGFAKKVYERSSLRTQCGTPGTYTAEETSRAHESIYSSTV